MSVFALYHGYPDYVGKRFIYNGVYTGPTSYTNTSNVATTGDTVQLPGFGQYIDTAHSTRTVSGTYTVAFRPSGPGPRATWKAVWAAASGGAEVTNGTNLSAETVIVSGFGGVY